MKQQMVPSKEVLVTLEKKLNTPKSRVSTRYSWVVVMVVFLILSSSLFLTYINTEKPEDHTTLSPVPSQSSNSEIGDLQITSLEQLVKKSTHIGLLLPSGEVIVLKKDHNQFVIQPLENSSTQVQFYKNSTLLESLYLESMVPLDINEPITLEMMKSYAFKYQDHQHTFQQLQILIQKEGQ